MFEDYLELCPECEEGRMRPDSKVGSDGKIEEPFSETRYLLQDMNAIIVDVWNLGPRQLKM